MQRYFWPPNIRPSESIQIKVEWWVEHQFISVLPMPKAQIFVNNGGFEDRFNQFLLLAHLFQTISQSGGHPVNHYLMHNNEMVLKMVRCRKTFWIAMEQGGIMVIHKVDQSRRPQSGNSTVCGMIHLTRQCLLEIRQFKVGGRSLNNTFMSSWIDK